MIEIHRRTGYLLLATLVAQVILISAQVRTSSGTRVLQAVTFGVFSQVQLGTAWVFGSVGSIWEGYFALRGAHEENQQLKQALSTAQIRLQEQQALSERVAQLERVLGLRERTPLRTVAANVIAGDATGMFRTLTIDKGSASGLRKDMAVIAPTGVVGRIVEPPPLYAAKVQLLIDRAAGAGALIERTGVGGVAVGHDRPGEEQLELELVSNLADAKAGDRLLTSGIDGIFPRGITIGTLSRVERGTGLYKRIWVTPAVDFNEVSSVLVVLDPPQATGPSPAATAAPPRAVQAAPATGSPATAGAGRPTPPQPAAAPSPAAARPRPANAPASTTPAAAPTPARTTPAQTTPAPATPPATEPAPQPPPPPGRGRSRR